MTAKNFDHRLAQLETITQPPAPATIQVVVHHWNGEVIYSPIQAAPDGKWAGLQRLTVIFTSQWRSESEKLNEPN